VTVAVAKIARDKEKMEEEQRRIERQKRLQEERQRRAELRSKYGFDSWEETLDTLEQGGMTDYKKYPEVYFAWKVAKNTDEFTLLHDLLTSDTWILTKAKKNIKECPFFQPKIEELNRIQGRLVLGYLLNKKQLIGFDPLDFTRGFFICGGTGSGKTYPVLRLMDHILTITNIKRGDYEPT
jgi:hypothetical protein